MTATERLFSYGTLQLGPVQRDRFGRSLAGVPDRLCGYRRDMVPIADEAVVLLSGLAEHPILRETGNPDDGVDGTVLNLTPAELEAADRYEVDAYRRVMVRLRSGTSAWAYVG